ncbi:hypothetical protein IAT38_008188 [Cryptococcus sp. DSM 104549]
MALSALSFLAHALIVASAVKHARAGYLSVNMTDATQCGRSVVQWSGDDGPYHLLLTPTEIKQHGYNVWIESIPATASSYELTIRQPAGLQFLLTMWGASGISYAATTDVMTVGSTTDTSCFLTDQAILDLYSFSFNLTTASGDNYPPQCSNISLSWPTSLESNVTSDVARRDVSDAVSSIELDVDATELEQLAASTSERSGNTTNPPTIFGVIPLGNSFSVPITFSKSSKFAKYLPASSLSDNPTTITRQGNTYLNLTVDMAKGTRFLLVAGIGSAEEWASGGSSKMFTVGQGSTNCQGSGDSSSAAPSVTGSRQSSTTATATATATVAPSTGGGSPVVRTVVAVVCSVIGTLVVVGLLFICRRARNRRRQVANGDLPPGSGGAFGMFGNSRQGKAVEPSADSELDLIASRTSRAGTGTGTGTGRGTGAELPPLMVGRDMSDSPAQSPVDGVGMDPFRDNVKQPFIQHAGAAAGSTYGSAAGAAARSDSGFAGMGAGGHGVGSGLGMDHRVSPIRERGDARDFRGESMARQTSMDALLPEGAAPPGEFGAGGGGYHSGSGSGSGSAGGSGSYANLPTSGSGTYYPPPSRQRSGPLVLHDPEAREGISEDDHLPDQDDITALKRDTLASTSNPTSPHPTSAGNTPTSATHPHGPNGPPGPGQGGRRRRERTLPPDQGMEYMVHRDAGRVVPPAENGGGNVLELPPRYEELTWTEEERRERERGTG